jgi:hypothetical protein
LELDDAIGHLSQRGPLPPREKIVAMLALLPPRSLPRETSSECIDHTAPARDADPQDALRSRQLNENLQRVLQEGFRNLNPEDRILLRLHFEGDLGMGEIARSLGADQKKLYRRKESLLRHLRELFQAARIDWEDVESVIDSGECQLAFEELAPEKIAARPSSTSGGVER